MTQAAQCRSVAPKKRIAITIPSSVHSGRLSRAPRIKPHAVTHVRKTKKTKNLISLTSRPKEMSGSGRELVHSSELPVIARP